MRARLTMFSQNPTNYQIYPKITRLAEVSFTVKSLIMSAPLIFDKKIIKYLQRSNNVRAPSKKIICSLVMKAWEAVSKCIIDKFSEFVNKPKKKMSKAEKNIKYL